MRHSMPVAVVLTFATLAIVVMLAACAADSSTQNRRGSGIAGQAGAAGGIAGAAGAAASGAGIVGAMPIDTSSNNGKCGAVEQQAKTQLQPADIIWAIDNSGSMTEEAAAVQQNMNSFTTRLASSGIDVHLVMISTTTAANAMMTYMPPPMMPPSMPPPPPPIFGGGAAGTAGTAGSAGTGTAGVGGVAGTYSPGPYQDECQGNNGVCIGTPFGSGNCPDDSKAPNFLHLLECVNSWNPLNKIVSTFPMWKSMLRPGASKNIVIVSDDNSIQGHYDADQFISAVDALDPTMLQSWKFNGIFCFSKCQSASNVGQVYQDLITKKGGVAGDLCKQDFKPVFDELAKAVIQNSAIACDWPIPPPPMGETLDPALVNVRFKPSQGSAVDIFRVPPGMACGPKGGWHFDDDKAPKMVQTCPATCTSLQADPGGKVSVLFGCASKLVPQ